MREPTEAQIVAGIAAAERESQAWSIRELGGVCIVDDMNRISIVPSANPQEAMRTSSFRRETFRSVEEGRDFVKWRVWGAGIKAALNA